MRISIIIPAFNEERLIRRTLDSVKQAGAAFTQRGWETELIVCDNNSTDRTADLARAAGAQVVFEPVNQIGRARNCGAAVAGGDWLLFVDADSQPSRELLAEVADQINTGRCLAGGCIVKLEGEHRFAALGAGLWNWTSRCLRLLAGSFIFCEAKAFREVGGFSNDLFVAEELDLSKRLKRLARERNKRLVILHGHPLLTSDRKVRLYRPAEHFRFLVKALFFPRRVLGNREACHPWYDGRR